MPRPEVKNCTFSLDGREVEAPAGMMLVDAANAYGDVEIPVFCYEPKLGQPVGACRMCLVEIEGIPKLQTACSTPIRDGMVVHTTTDRVHQAQRAVVEFLLINHPLDCPVCDKGGECPLQDVTYGWGPGTSRFIEPKRHFKKPLELSPLVAIDRERCILCYRCVRYSQEISEDYQLILLERGADSFVGTFDGHPYVAPFSGNIIELCPVGALTSRAYRFRARPWDIEGAGHRLRGLRRPVQRRADRARRPRPARARPRQRRGRRRLALRQGPLLLPGRAFRRAHHHADGARGRRADARFVGEGARRGGFRFEEGRLARVRDRGRDDHQRRGVPAAVAAARRPRLEPHERAGRRRAAAGRAARAGRAGAAGDGAGPRVRPHGLPGRLRPDRRGADLGPAHPQGHPPPRHEARRRQRAADRAGSRAPTCALRFAPGARRGLPGRAGRGAERRRGQPRRRGLRRGHERHRRARVRGRAARRGRGDRDRLRRARAARERGPRAAEHRRAPEPRRASPAPGCSSCRPRRTAAAMREAGFAPGHGPGSRRSPRPATTPRASPRASPAATCTRSGCTTSTRCAPSRTARPGTARCTRRRP